MNFEVQFRCNLLYRLILSKIAIKLFLLHSKLELVKMCKGHINFGPYSVDFS